MTSYETRSALNSGRVKHACSPPHVEPYPVAHGPPLSAKTAGAERYCGHCQVANPEIRGIVSRISAIPSTLHSLGGVSPCHGRGARFSGVVLPARQDLRRSLPRIPGSVPASSSARPPHTAALRCPCATSISPVFTSTPGIRFALPMTSCRRAPSPRDWCTGSIRPLTSRRRPQRRRGGAGCGDGTFCLRHAGGGDNSSQRNSAVAPLTLFQTALALPDRFALTRPRPPYPHGAGTGPRRQRRAPPSVRGKRSSCLRRAGGSPCASQAPPGAIPAVTGQKGMS